MDKNELSELSTLKLAKRYAATGGGDADIERELLRRVRARGTRQLTVAGRLFHLVVHSDGRIEYDDYISLRAGRDQSDFTS